VIPPCRLTSLSVPKKHLPFAEAPAEPLTPEFIAIIEVLAEQAAREHFERGLIRTHRRGRNGRFMKKDE
jgi:hypothetical protein